jgi:chromosome partitioning protein
MDQEKDVSTTSNQASSARIRTRALAKKHNILILNAKGGSGKSTIATNLASYLLSLEKKPALLDFDPQGSSSYWLSVRPDSQGGIHGIKAFKKAVTGMTRSQQLATPAEVTHIIYDTPGSLDGIELDQLIKKAETIIIPVQPSQIDIHAATRFIQKVLLNPHCRNKNKRIAVVANRARKNSNAYTKLRLFLNRLRIPLITTFRDTQQYVKAFEAGLGILELNETNKQNDAESWEALFEWIEQKPGCSPENLPTESTNL